MKRQSQVWAAADWAGFDAELRESCGIPRAEADADIDRFAVDGVAPGRVVCPSSVEQVRRVIQIASARGLTVVPAGFGAHLGLGAPPPRPFIALSLRSLDRLVDHQPANMTVTAQAGLSVAALQAAVAGSGQWLPVDPPLPAATSVGGLISANLSGPSRFSQGTVRDLLIGVTVARPDGALAKSGGRVVKNVAGYDLGKLYCGALGTLGVVVEATFKLRTLPEATAVARITCAGLARAQSLLEGILAAPLEPSFIELLAGFPETGAGHVVVVGFGGPREDVADQSATLRRLVDGADRLEELEAAEKDAVIAELRDARALGEAFLALKASVLPARVTAFMRTLEEEGDSSGLTMAVQAHAGNGIIHVRVSRPAAPDPRTQARVTVDRLRAEAAGLGGTLVVERAAPEVKPGLDLWGGDIQGLALMKRIKQTLDPGGILSPGRFVDGIQ